MMFPVLDNLIGDLRREREKEQEIAEAAGHRGDTQSYVAHSCAERALRRAIEIAERYSASA